jgi:phosphate transport system substrate-binding protein
MGPMTAATFILIPEQPPDAAAATSALKLFTWAYAKGGKMAEEIRLCADAEEGCE